MLFTVTYREKSGAKAEVEIEASSRAACVAECKRRGIAPVGIREGRASARPRAAETAAPHDGRAKHSGGTLWRAAILAASILAVVGGGLWWWLSARDEARPPEPKAVKVVKDVVKVIKAPTVTKNISPAPIATNAVATTNQPMTHREKMIAKYGKEPVRVRPGGKYRNGERLPEKRSIFHFAAEKEIDRIISAEPGHRIIGRFPKGFIERDFKKSLEARIEITDEDTPEDIARKQQMIAVKEQLRQAMERGESLDDILEDARKEVNALADFRDNMIKNLVQIKKSGGTPQEIEDYYAAANKMLAEKQIKPLLTPFQIKEKIERLKEMRSVEQ